MSSTVLDASALLAFLHRETGFQVVADHIKDGAVSAVNLSEVVARLADRGLAEQVIRQSLEEMSIAVIPFETEQAYTAGMSFRLCRVLRLNELRPETRSIGISLGDRACLALARQLGVPALTADRRWAELDVGIDVQVIR